MKLDIEDLKRLEIEIEMEENETIMKEMRLMTNNEDAGDRI